VRADDKRFGPRPKRACPKCGLAKVRFGTDDPDVWCRSCLAAPVVVELPAKTNIAEVKLSGSRVVRVEVLGGMVVLTSGRNEARSESQAFVAAGMLTIPFRALPEVRAALAKLARMDRKADRSPPSH
jgi:uncharacterized Zn finger protein (UPF0148 family)